MEEMGRSFMDRLFNIEKIGQKIIKYRLAIIIISVVGTLLLIWPLTKTTIINDPDHWAHQDHPYVKLNQVILDKFGGGKCVTGHGQG